MLSNQSFITALLLFVTSLVFSQDKSELDHRYISVTGSAEVVVQPDEIELEIILKEYSGLSSLSSIENKFVTILEKYNISTKDLEFSKSEFYWYKWWRNYRYSTMKEKIYKIRLDSQTDFLALVKDLNYKGVHSLRISDTSNSELQKLRKDIKISAVKAAQNKAKYLLESIDEKLGKVITIEEVPESNNYYWRQNQAILSNVVVSTNPSDSEIENVSSIKLRYEIKAKFGIL